LQAIQDIVVTFLVSLVHFIVTFSGHCSQLLHLVLFYLLQSIIQAFSSEPLCITTSSSRNTCKSMRW